MRKRMMLAILCILLVFNGAAWGAVFSQTHTDPSGASITTIVDTDQRSVRYEFDFTALPYSYEQIKIGQPGYPYVAIVETWPNWPTSPFATQFIYYEVNPGQIETRLEIQYQTATDPPAVNWIELHYETGYFFSGWVAPPAAEDNVQITYREPEGGFPPGQEDNILIGAYTPSITNDDPNTPPVADAGPDQTVLVGDTVFLDGSGSSDADNDPLTFSWSFVSKPAGSTATLSDSTAEMPTFVADEPGTYVVQLIVNDGMEDSDADTVNISAADAAIFPQILINGLTGFITVQKGSSLLIEVELDAGNCLGKEADWWVLAITPAGKWYYFKYQRSVWRYAGPLDNVATTYQGILNDLAPLELDNLDTSNLSVGKYTFYFGVDTIMNGLIDYDALHHDSIVVNLIP